jgi:hypothetical protein
MTATLGNLINELITLLGEGHEVEKWLLKNLVDSSPNWIFRFKKLNLHQKISQ